MNETGKNGDESCVCGHIREYHSGGYGDCQTCDCRGFDDDFPTLADARASLVSGDWLAVAGLRITEAK